ncbi:MAG: DUF366 family protein [Armatimonadetes bacterium]|nr:DUF366 family protein [Armatimonadota bacterium]
MKTKVLQEEIAYTGAELRSGWIAERTGLSGDAVVAFLGPCDIKPAHMVDTVDLEAGATIASSLMLHLLAEHPGVELELITTRQRLLMAIAGEIINSHLGETLVRREGDDLYLRDRKLSISVATVSPTSGLIHSGFNVRGEGAPVAAIGLADLGLDPRELAQALLSAYRTEMETAQEASRKVRPVA